MWERIASGDIRAPPKKRDDEGSRVGTGESEVVIA